MKMRSIHGWIVTTILFLWVSSPAFAPTVVLTLLVGGSIVPAPDWQDEVGASITSIGLSFAGIIAGTVPGVAVESMAVNAKLVTTTYPATVALVRPSGCSIGANSVSNTNVHFLMNTTPYTTNTNISIPSSGTQVFKLRFAAAGNHGTQSGAVTCTGSGTLTYSY